jgi:hypothetical protein
VSALQTHCAGDLRQAACSRPADCGGDRCWPVWGRPDGYAGFDDVLAALFAFQKLPGTISPDLTWVDLHGNDSGISGSERYDPPNWVANFADIQQFLLAFQGRPYPYVDPAGCPDVGSWP